MKFELHVDFRRIATALERIADSCERAFPQPRPIVQSKPAGPENLTQFSPEDQWNREEEEDRQREAELPGR